MSDDIEFKIIKTSKSPPEGSGAPADCDPNYLDEGEEAPEGATVYDGPQKGQFYCSNYENIDESATQESVSIREEENIQAWGLSGTKELEEVQLEELDKGEVVVFQTDDGVYTGRLISTGGGVAKINSTISGSEIDIPVDNLLYQVDGANDRDILEFRFGNVGYNELESESIRDIFNLPKESSIDTDVDSVDPGDLCLIEKQGFGSICSSVIETTDEKVVLGTYDSKLSGAEDGARIELDKEEFYNDNIIGTVEGLGLKQATESITGLDPNKHFEQSSFDQVTFNDNISLTVNGYGNLVGSVFNTDYREDGILGVRVSNGAGEDRFIWAEEEDITDLNKISDSVGPEALGIEYGTLQFPKDAQLNRTPPDSDNEYEDGDIGLADVSGTQISGVVEENGLIADPNKYSTISKNEDGEYELETGPDVDNIKLEQTEDSFVKVPIDSTWIGKLENVERSDILKMDPGEWDLNKEIERAGMSDLRTLAKENYKAKVNTNSSIEGWWKFIEESLNASNGSKKGARKALDAIMYATGLYEELADKSYEEGFDDEDSTRQRRREKFERIERSAEEGFIQYSKVEVADAPHPVSFGYYKRTEREEDDNYDYFNTLFSEEVDNYENGNKALEAYSGGGARAADTAPIYHALKEITGYDEVPRYYEDVDEIDGMDPIEYWREKRGDEFADQLSEDDFEQGQPLVQFDSDKAAVDEDIVESIKQIRNKTQELLQESLDSDVVPLYRAIGGDEIVSQVQTDLEDEDVTHYNMEQETVNSWTSSPEKALMFANNKSAQKHSEETDNWAIVREDIPIENIAAFSEFTNGLDTGGQAEFLVEGSEDGLEIPTDNIITGQGFESPHMFELPDDPSMFEEKMKSLVGGIGRKTLKKFRENDIENENKFADLTYPDIKDISGLGPSTALRCMAVARENSSVLNPTKYDNIGNDALEELHNKGIVTLEDYWAADPNDIPTIHNFPDELGIGRGSRDLDEIRQMEDVTDDLIEVAENLDFITNKHIEELIDNFATTKEDLTEVNQGKIRGTWNFDRTSVKVRDAIAEYTKGNEEKAQDIVNEWKGFIDKETKELDTIRDSAKEYEGNSPDTIRYPTEEIELDDGGTAEIPESTLVDLAAWSTRGFNDGREEKLYKSKNIKELDLDPKYRDWMRVSDELEEQGRNHRVDSFSSGISIELLRNIYKTTNESETINDIVNENKSMNAGVEIISDEKSDLKKWRIYVDYAHDIPDWAERIEGPRGGVYYEIDDNPELVNELLRPPLHEVENPEDYPEITEGTDDPIQTVLPDADGETGQAAIDQYSMPGSGEYIEVTEKDDKHKDGPTRAYWRVYVDNEEQAPDWANVQGPSTDGNLYYIVFDEDLFAELVTEPKHTVGSYDIESYLDGTYNDEIEEKGVVLKRQFKIYANSASDIPDWANVQIGPSGGIFYVVYYKPLFNALMQDPKHEIPDDFNLSSYMYQGGDSGQEKSMQIVDLNKRRIYIDEVSEAPDGKQVHQGDNGGKYYISGSESSKDDEKDNEYRTYTDFSEKLADAVKNDTVNEIETSEYADHIDSINDGNLLEDVYRKEKREAVKREIENWANQLERHFDFLHRVDGPHISKDVKRYKQVESLCDVGIDKDDLSTKEQNLIDEWENLKSEFNKNESIDIEIRRKFKDDCKKVDNPNVVYYLWEKGLDNFTDLNTILADRLIDLGYSPRTQIVPGMLRRLDYKYNYVPSSECGKLCDCVENNDILRSIIQEDNVEIINNVDNVDLLRDIKSALKYKGISSNSIVVEAINKRISEINPPSLDAYSIESKLYDRIVDRPAGYKGSGQGVDKKPWNNVFKSVSTEDLQEFVRAAEDRNNFAHASIVKGLLCYRNGSDLSSRDMISITYDGGDLDTEQLYQMIERIFASLNPVIGAYLLSAITSVKSESLSSNKEGYALFRGEIAVDGRKTGDKWQIFSVLAHEIGHILHRIMGLDQNEPVEDESGQLDELGYTVIQPENDYNDTSQNFYAKMRKEWTRYTSQDVSECRIYQRVSPEVFMASTFSLWITDPMKLEIVHESIYMVYESFFGQEDK